MSPGFRCRTRGRREVFARTIDDILWRSGTGRESETRCVEWLILVSGDDKELCDGLLVCGLDGCGLWLVCDWRVRLLENGLRLWMQLWRQLELLLWMLGNRKLWLGLVEEVMLYGLNVVQLVLRLWLVVLVEMIFLHRSMLGIGQHMRWGRRQVCQWMHVLRWVRAWVPVPRLVVMLWGWEVTVQMCGRHEWLGVRVVHVSTAARRDASWWCCLCRRHSWTARWRELLLLLLVREGRGPRKRGWPSCPHSSRHSKSTSPTCDFKV